MEQGAWQVKVQRCESLGTKSRQVWLSPRVCKNSEGERKGSTEPERA